MDRDAIALLGTVAATFWSCPTLELLNERVVEFSRAGYRIVRVKSTHAPYGSIVMRASTVVKGPGFESSDSMTRGDEEYVVLCRCAFTSPCALFVTSRLGGMMDRLDGLGVRYELVRSGGKCAASNRGRGKVVCVPVRELVEKSVSGDSDAAIVSAELRKQEEAATRGIWGIHLKDPTGLGVIIAKVSGRPSAPVACKLPLLSLMPELVFKEDEEEEEEETASKSVCPIGKCLGDERYFEGEIVLDDGLRDEMVSVGYRKRLGQFGGLLVRSTSKTHMGETVRWWRRLGLSALSTENDPFDWVLCSDGVSVIGVQSPQASAPPLVLPTLFYLLPSSATTTDIPFQSFTSIPTLSKRGLLCQSSSSAITAAVHTSPPIDLRAILTLIIAVLFAIAAIFILIERKLPPPPQNIE